MNICITGANGQLGQTFRGLSASFPHWTFHFADRTQADLLAPTTVSTWLDDRSADVLINCAAYTNVNRAESEPEPAQQINVTAVAHLAAHCGRRGIPFFHFSSDYVYHLNQGIAFRETDATEPKGVYAQTKLEGEQQALAIYPNTTVIRTSWVFSPFGHNFLRTMLRLGAAKTLLKVVDDQIGTPTYTVDLAGACLHMLRQWARQGKDLTLLGGIFNYSNEGVCSWYDFALAIFDISNTDCRVVPVGSDEYPGPVERPPFSVMDKSKIKAAFGLEIPHWREGVRRCLGQL